MPKTTERYILAIDQGTTGSRAILYDRHGRPAASSYREFPQYFPKPGWVEHDANEIWDSVHDSIRDVLRKKPSARIEAVGITNQRETTVLWNAETGKPVGRAIVWQCRRTAERCKALSKRPGLVDSIRRKTGLPLDAYFSATKIEWLLKNNPQAKLLAKKGALRFGTTDSWVLWNLTAGHSHATDHTNASRTLLYDISKRRWDPELLGLFGVPSSCLPEVRDSSGVFGTTVRTAGLPAGIPIAGIAGDQQAALFGQACFDAGEVKNTYGTGSFILMNTGNKPVRSASGLITTLCCDGRGHPAYALEGSVFVAGSAIQWLRDGLQILSNAHQSEKMCRDVPDTDGVYFVPALTGLGAPWWDPDARGLICGLTRGTKREHLVRAAVEAMCFQTKDVLDAMVKDSKIPVRSLKVDGGASSNGFLCSFQSDLLGIPVERPANLETTSLGAAMLAGLAVKFWKDARELKGTIRPGLIVKPSSSSADIRARHKAWLQAVHRTLSL
jgi:glycerol kinase